MSNNHNDTILDILVIEDDSFTSMLICKMLETIDIANMQCYEVNTLALALDKLKLIEFDLILADLNLPDSHGMYTFDRLKENTVVPILTISGHMDSILKLESENFPCIYKTDLSKELLTKNIRILLQGIKLRKYTKELAGETSKLLSLSSKFNNSETKLDNLRLNNNNSNMYI